MNIKVNQEERAFRAWNVLVNHASEKEKITYKALGEKLNVHHRTCRYFLELIQDYCLQEKMPPLTIIVHNQAGEIGQGFIAWDLQNKEEGFEKVFNFNWRNYPNPFSYAKTGKTKDSIVEQILVNAIRSEELYAQVKVRGIAQAIFRKSLLKAYESKCAFCRFPYEVALEASHIIPWSKCEESEKMSINNGLLLCSNHHKLFDNGIIRVDENYIIQGVGNYYSNIIGKKIKLPKNKEHYPSKIYFKKRESISKISY
ncbi:HNH endonuclease [Paenibacillus sp. Z6-24]